MKRRGSIKVSGSVYAPSEPAMLFAQVLDEVGDPVNDATVLASVFKQDGAKWVDAESMSYIAGSNGLYKYGFTAPAVVQRMVADVSCADPVSYGSSDLYVAEWSENIDYLKQKEAGKWKIEDEQLTYYAEDGVTVLRRFNLYDKKGNPTNLNPYERVPV